MGRLDLDNVNFSVLEDTGEARAPGDGGGNDASSGNITARGFRRTPVKSGGGGGKVRTMVHPQQDKGGPGKVWFSIHHLPHSRPVVDAKKSVGRPIKCMAVCSWKEKLMEEGGGPISSVCGCHCLG